MENENPNSIARAAVIININGNNNQIMPHATQGVQHFYGVSISPIGTGHHPHPEEEEGDEALRLARGTLSIYYPDLRELDDIIRRIGDCRSASDLANLVVNDMHRRTILTVERMVSKDFIEALRHFVTFKSGTSVGNIRAQINKVRRDGNGGSDKI